MPNLTQANRQLFNRPDDERFETLNDLWEFRRRQKAASTDRWTPPCQMIPRGDGSRLNLAIGSDGAFALNHWSFSPLCRMCGETLNRLTPDTASRALRETWPEGTKPLQILTIGESVRSIHGVTYSRLWSADLIAMLQEFAVDFQPPPKAFNGATGLSAGEQEFFCFLIDPTGWAEIGNQTFASGFFCWKSEVGRSSVGISTFWFQSICQNHIVSDDTEIVEFTRKHTGKVHESLGEIRRIVECLVEKRDARRDGFVSLMRKAMTTTLGTDAGRSRSCSHRAVSPVNSPPERWHSPTRPRAASPSFRWWTPSRRWPGNVLMRPTEPTLIRERASCLPSQCERDPRAQTRPRRIVVRGFDPGANETRVDSDLVRAFNNVAN